MLFDLLLLSDLIDLFERLLVLEDGQSLPEDLEALVLPFDFTDLVEYESIQIL